MNTIKLVFKKHAKIFFNMQKYFSLDSKRSLVKTFCTFKYMKESHLNIKKKGVFCLHCELDFSDAKRIAFQIMFKTKDFILFLNKKQKYNELSWFDNLFQYFFLIILEKC